MNTARPRFTLTLSLLEGTFAVCQLGAGEQVPAWALDGSFCSATRTAGELSIVCEQRQVPANLKSERGWRCLMAHGPFDFALTGILASLLVPLAEAEVGIFALSTYDTDYLLVKEADLNRAIEALAGAGHTILVV